MHRWKGKEASDNDDGDDDGDDDSADQPTPLTMRKCACGGRGGGRQDKVKKQRKKRSEEPRPPLRDRADLQCPPNRATGC